jgi:imidazolonepropionase-like amidohydrolase
MNTFILSNVKTITQYGIINNGYICVKRGIIMAIGRSSPVKVHRSCHVVDGGGGWLLPGIIDISNYLFGIGGSSSFFTFESIFASHGITSIFHTISRFELEKELQ